MLRSVGLDVTNANPLFSDSAPEQYRNKYFETAIQPLINKQKIDNWLSGNQANDSTLGGNILSSLAVSGANDAFFAGEDYRSGLVDQLLNRRNALYGQNVNTAQGQDQLGINRDLGLEGQITNRLADLNNYNSNSARTLSSLYSGQQAASAARSANRMSALTGIGGLLGSAALTPFGASQKSLGSRLVGALKF